MLQLVVNVELRAMNLSRALLLNIHDKLKHVGHYKVKHSGLALLLTLLLSSLVYAQSPSVKTYRGSIGDKHIEMRFTIAGTKVSGTYFYDRFKQDIPLDGTYDARGQLELIEGSGKRKTGKFICKRESETPDVDLDCEWSRPDGTGKALVFLVEQGLIFTKDTKIVPKLFIDRTTKAESSYPQLTAAVLTPAMTEFNRVIETRAQAAMKEFRPETGSRSTFDTTYNVLFADDEKVSIEMVEYSDVGAAHPNTRLWTLNYSLKANRELTLEDIVTPDDEFRTVIAEFVAKDISRRATEMEMREARRSNSPPPKRDEPFMTTDQLPEMDTWALGAKGLVVYFDFPHVIAVFDKTVVPYQVIARYLKRDGVKPQAQ